MTERVENKLWSQTRMKHSLNSKLSCSSFLGCVKECESFFPYWLQNLARFVIRIFIRSFFFSHPPLKYRGLSCRKVLFITIDIFQLDHAPPKYHFFFFFAAPEKHVFLYIRTYISMCAHISCTLTVEHQLNGQTLSKRKGCTLIPLFLRAVVFLQK